MTFSINIYGHANGNADEAKETEEAIIEEAKSFVAGLGEVGDVSSATGMFQHLGQVNLAPDVPTEEQLPTEPEPPTPNKPAEPTTGTP